MKIFPRHKKVFKKCLEMVRDEYFWLCGIINRAIPEDIELQQECKEILFYYFRDDPKRVLLWMLSDDNLTKEELYLCRILALQSLISMDS